MPSCANFFKETNPAENEYKHLMLGLWNILKNVGPEDLVTLALEDREVYEICRDNADLRQTYILGAIRKYHQEKLLHEEVYNRTARYMVVLDEFLELQDSYEAKKTKKRFRFISFFTCSLFHRTGDAAENGTE